MKYIIPRSIEEAGRMAAEHAGSAFIAGGTDLSILILEGLLSPDILIDISRIDELKQIDLSGNFISLGSGVSMKDLSSDRHVPMCLSGGAASVGSPQIRNMATLGGNICNASPCGDTLPGLLVLDAVLTLAGPEGRRSVPAKDFFTGPKATVLSPRELLVSIDIPEDRSTGHSGFAKIGKRRGQVISQANAAVWFTLKPGTQVIEDIRIAAGSVAPVPLRLGDLEKDLQGKPIDHAMKEHIRRAAGGMVSPISDVRATEWYRRGIMGSLIVQALESAAGGGSE